MLWDKQTLFSDGQTLAAGTSTNVVQVQRGPGDAGVGDDVSLAVHVSGTTMSTALTVTLQQAAVAAMTSATTVATYTVPMAAVNAGGLVLAVRLPGGTTGKFLRLSYAGTVTTGGPVTAGLVKDAPAGVRPPLNSGL